LYKLAAALVQTLSLNDIHWSLPHFDASIPAASNQQSASPLHCCHLCDAVRVHQVLHSELAAQVWAAVRCHQAGPITQAALLDDRHTRIRVAAVAVEMCRDLISGRAANTHRGRLQSTSAGSK
jgi:hypothetical protein